MFYQALSPSFQEQLHSLASGTTVSIVNKSKFNNINVVLPPLPEQERIVSILDEAFAALATATANAEKNLVNTRELFESKLNRVFSQKGDGWEEATFLDLCKQITVGHVGSMKKHYRSAGISFLRSQNIRPFAVDTNNLMFIDPAFEATLTKSRLYPGDVAIVRTGYPGTTAVIPEWLGDANCSDLVIVRPGKDIDSHFVAAFFNSPIGRKMVGGQLVGAAQKHFNVTSAKQVQFPYPSLPEQRAIVQELDDLSENVKRLEAIFQCKHSTLANLKQSILHKAFTGELTAGIKAADRSLSEAGV